MDEKELQRINDLTIRYVQGIITPEEQVELDLWLEEHPINRERFNLRVQEEGILESLAFEEEGERRYDRARARLKEFLDPTPVVQLRTRYRRYRFVWYTASAAVVLLLITGSWLINKDKQNRAASLASNKTLSLPPAGNRAILQLADGSRIDLATATKGIVLAEQGNAQVIKEDSGQLSYQYLKGTQAAIAYNTIFTPRGGTYRVVLPDGTVVWLNAQSSVHFPTIFTGQQREVEITGEAYFEVAQNKALPFIVKADGMDIKVLGTHFDVKAYHDEQAKQATLLEGSIALQTEGKTVLLHPGEQANVTKQVTVVKVDTDEAIAWKDGFFMFNHADIESIMRQISRWYNVDVVYEGQRTERKLTGRVSRKAYAEDVLDILKANGYHISIAADGKTITIQP